MTALPTNAIISNLRFYIRHKEIYYNANYAKSWVDILFPDIYFTEQAVTQRASITTDYVDFANNPDTLAAWTYSDIAAAQFGCFEQGITHTSYYDAYCYDLWCDVTYTLPSAGEMLMRNLKGVGLFYKQHPKIGMPKLFGACLKSLRRCFAKAQLSCPRFPHKLDAGQLKRLLRSGLCFEQSEIT